MSDQGKVIAVALDALIQEGKRVKAREEFRSDPESLKGFEESIKRSSKSKKASKKKAAEIESLKKALKAIKTSSFGEEYQPWYSQALRVVERLLPDRYVEFRQLYRPDKEPKDLDWVTYSVSDYVHGTVVSDSLGQPMFSSRDAALRKFQNQIDILTSARKRLDSALADIQGTLETTLLDDELETASGLLKTKHLRSAGVVAGVALERHLKRVVVNHEISFRGKAQIGKLNDALKEAKVYDVPQWRAIAHLGDLRNLCAHDGEREPKAEDVEDLIRGTEKVIATVF